MNSVTIYNPYLHHDWYYDGPDPTIKDHEIALNYIKTKFNKSDLKCLKKVR